MVDFRLLKKVEQEFNIGENSLRSRSRLAHIVVVRHAVNNLLRREFGYTYAEIGRIMKRDHATIIHSTKQHSTGWFQYEDTYSRMLLLFADLILLRKGNIKRYSIEMCEDEIAKLTSLIASSKAQLERVKRRSRTLNAKK
tara:strand:+ start:1425 stop:1844 length:420 start_codon:yes stop_codon:yes gene_type:complete